jgi:GT2 family glycosyltransferase
LQGSIFDINVMEKDTRDLTLGPQGGRFHNEVEKEPETAAQQQETSRGMRDYCVAIRTLGTAGEKYQTLLNSLVAQTLPPKKIFVYIPYGYPVPKETVGIEQIVRCEKGMVAQRSLPFDEMDTEYILFCDDDVFLPPTIVENLFAGLEENDGDCIAPQVYNHSKESVLMKILMYLNNSTSPRNNDGWANRVKRDAGFSYNNHPLKAILPTQTAPFASLLCKKTAFKAIHFEDERWLDSFSFASQDDQLFYYKLYLYGYRVLMCYNSGIQHLDAKAGVRVNAEKRMFYKKELLFTIWYRTIYNIKQKSQYERSLCCLAFTWRNLLGVIAMVGDALRYKQPIYILDYFKGLYAGYRYIHSNEYKKVPSFDAYLKK